MAHVLTVHRSHKTWGGHIPRIARYEPNKVLYADVVLFNGSSSSRAGSQSPAGQPKPHTSVISQVVSSY